MYKSFLLLLLVKQFHKLLYEKNVGVDFIFPENPEFENYDLVIIPGLYIATDALLKKIDTYVKNGGHVIMQFKSGFCNENSMVRPVMAPGPLRKACGFYYQEFTNFDKMSLKDNPFGVKENDNIVTTWAEYIIPESAKPLAFYDHHYFQKYPAVTINNYGDGTLLYEGCMVSDSIQDKILTQELERANLMTPDQQIHFPLITKSGTNEDGNTIRYYYNYSSVPREFDYPYAKGFEILTNKKISKKQTLQIEPWGVLIIEE